MARAGSETWAVGLFLAGLVLGLAAAPARAQYCPPGSSCANQHQQRPVEEPRQPRYEPPEPRYEPRPQQPYVPRYQPPPQQPYQAHQPDQPQRRQDSEPPAQWRPAPPPPRHFGSAPEPASPPHERRFGTAPESTAPESTAPPSERRFGTPPGAAAPPAERRFGAGPAPTPPHGAATPVREPRAAAYVYHGQSFAPFRAARYRWPPHMHYDRYGIGGHLPLALLIADYLILDWTEYALAAPPGGENWVRYGPDLLLVDMDTGEVFDAIHGAFIEMPDAGDQPSANADDLNAPADQ